jgi:dienelactone hydrolase
MKKNRWSAALLPALCAVAAFAGDASPGSPAAIPAAAFFNVEDMDEPVLSPEGDALAIRVRNTAGRRQLAILDTTDFTKVKVIAGFVDGDVARVRWVDNQRLIYSVWSQQESAYFSRDYVQMAVDRDGQHQRLLAGYAPDAIIEAGTTDLIGQFVRTLNDGTGDVISAWWDHTNRLGYGNHWTDSTPKRYDTRHTKSTNLFPGRTPHDIQEWIVDEQGVVRAGMSYTATESALFTPGENGEWTERLRFDAWGDAPTRFEPVDLATDGRMYVRHAASGPGAGLGLYTLDLKTAKIDPDPIVSAKGFDLYPTLVEDRRRHKVLGVRYETDAEGTLWFDDAMKAAQAKVDALLPGRINRLEPAICGCASRILVTSFSDRQPALFYLYDRSTGKMDQIGDSRPKIDARLAAETDFVRIKARDGLDLPVYLTRPKGKGPWPTVVLVHGGPNVRGWSWEWDADSQFLASRGYLVVKPEFRGSSGYGEEWSVAGRRQWGLKMQDDIADATRWAAAKGLADPARTCIAGANYGGYATLMGLVRYPELYRCGIASSAVTDLGLMHDIHWSELGEDYRENAMPILVGDPDKDSEQFAATSPLKQAARITRPLLLAHGGIDRRVPIEHATRLRDALLAHHAPLTWVEYKDEAHGLYKPENRVDFYTRMERFLAANIGPDVPAAAEAAGATTTAH